MKFKYSPALHHLPAGTLIFLAVLISTILITVPGFGESPKYPVARVNGVPIYRSELSCAVDAIVAEGFKTPSGENAKPSRRSRAVSDRQVLDRMVNYELLYQESLKHRFHGLTAESDERYRQEVKRAGGENKLASTLQCNDRSPEQFRKTIFRRLSIKHLLDEVVYSRIGVTQEEVRDYYDRNLEKFREPGTIRLKQILVKAPPDPESLKWQQARERAYEIYNSALKGEDFVRLVHKHSDDPVTATAGGDLGPIKKGNHYGVIDTAIFAMKPGTVIKPIQSRQGFHIFKIVEITQPSTRKLEEVEKRITTVLRRKQARKLTYQLLNDLKEKAQIEILTINTQEPGTGSQ